MRLVERIERARVFPAHAGMIRHADALYSLPRCVPRARGDDPLMRNLFNGGEKCSPRTRG